MNTTATTMGSMLDQMALDFGDDYITGGTISINDHAVNSTITNTGTYVLNNGIGGVTTNGAPWITTTGGTSGMWPGSITLGNIAKDTQTHALEVKCDANFEGELRIKGVSLSDRLDAIDQRLNILRPNADLEEKWEKLRTLGTMYRELEAEIIDMQKVWDTLKA